MKCGECNNPADFCITESKGLKENENAISYYYCKDCYEKNQENAN